MTRETTHEAIMADAGRLHTEDHAPRRTVLDVQGLGKHVALPGGPLTILDDIGFRIGHGDTVAIVGASGSGKSTLLSLLAGLDVPSAGSVALDGERISGMDEDGRARVRGEKVGFVFQSFQLLPSLTALENVMLPLELRGDADAETPARQILEKVGLGQRLDHYPRQLSGGEQQRVALARAMAMKPRLMLLDEPFSALDTGLRASMRKAVAELLEAAGITTILVTHDQAEALSFADQVAVMREGKFSQVGTPRELYLKPKDRMVAEFLGEALVLPARIADGFAESPLGRIPLDSVERRDVARIMLRPEQVMIERASRQDAAAAQPGLLYGEVTESEFAGASCAVAVKLLNSPDPPEAAAIGSTPLMLRRPGIDAPAVGDVVRIRVVGTAHVLA